MRKLANERMRKWVNANNARNTRNVNNTSKGMDGTDRSEERLEISEENGKVRKRRGRVFDEKRL